MDGVVVLPFMLARCAAAVSLRPFHSAPRPRCPDAIRWEPHIRSRHPVLVRRVRYRVSDKFPGLPMG